MPATEKIRRFWASKHCCRSFLSPARRNNHSYSYRDTDTHRHAHRDVHSDSNSDGNRYRYADHYSHTIPCYQARFVSDVTIPDGTVVAPTRTLPRHGG